MQQLVQPARDTLRGMHLQTEPHGEAKLVRCLRGAIWDVGLDLRRDSETYLRWHAVELTADNRRGYYLPAGLAHGFQTLTDDCEVQYAMGHVYVPDAAGGVRWDDPAFAIDWPAPQDSGRCPRRTPRTRTTSREPAAGACDGCERLRGRRALAPLAARGFEVHAVGRGANRQRARRRA